ncbi:MAG: hypothetical protein LBG22_01485, partial [Treponema sp.]|nr:hypothetical protein [Treponema sp.]
AAERTGYGCSLKVLDSGFIPLLRPRGAGYETLATNQYYIPQNLNQIRFVVFPNSDIFSLCYEKITSMSRESQGNISK